jgi:signal transduction histidine kinase
LQTAAGIAARGSVTTSPDVERPRKTRGPVPVPIGIAFAIALLAIILDAVLVYRLVLETRQLAEGVRRTRVATARLLAVQQLLVDAETGQRGYLLTGRDDYLAPYTSAIERLQTALSELRQSFDLTERDRTDYQTLARLAQAKQDELARSIAAYKTSGPQAALGLVTDDTGRHTMEAIRALVQMRTNELEPDVEARRVALFRSMERAAVFTTAAGIVSAIVLLGLGVLVLMHFSRIHAKETRLEETAEARASQLGELSRHLLTVREEERARIAHELHDELGSSLTLLSQDIARLRKAALEGKPASIELVEGMHQVVQTSVQQQRHLVHSLRPTVLDSLGLRAAIESLAQEFSKHSGIPCRCAMDVSVDKVVGERAISLYRIVQESLTNIARHAGATSAEITARVVGNVLTVSVSDDGQGVANASGRPRGSLGLMGMRERARYLGGSLSVESRRDRKGTVVELRIPAHTAGGAASETRPNEFGPT